MGCGRALLCVLFPPAAVFDRGAGNIILVTILWICLWIPGSIAAWMINNSAANTKKIQKQLAQQHKEDLQVQQQIYRQQQQYNQQANQYYNQQQQYPPQQPPMPPQQPPQK